jgi:nucleoside diphosphate kinase
MNPDAVEQELFGHIITLFRDTVTKLCELEGRIKELEGEK